MIILSMLPVVLSAYQAPAQEVMQSSIQWEYVVYHIHNRHRTGITATRRHASLAKADIDLANRERSNEWIGFVAQVEKGSRCWAHFEWCHECCPHCAVHVVSAVPVAIMGVVGCHGCGLFRSPWRMHLAISSRSTKDRHDWATVVRNCCRTNGSTPARRFHRTP